jgi:hypothetical protein
MDSDLDIFRAAALLIRNHGDEAEQRAIKRADELAEAGDAVGVAVYLAIVKAIGELRRGRGPGESVH